MKVKFFQARKLSVLEEAVNEFLASNEIYSVHTQFSTVYAEDSMEHIMFHTLVLFYYPRVDEPDPFEEEKEEESITIGTPEEAARVAMSLTDEDIERLELQEEYP